MTHIPTGLGEDVGRWLAHEGLTPIVPPIRSSDLYSISDPLAYFLSRRLGLQNPLSYSKALVQGSWFHTCFRCWGQDTTNWRHWLDLSWNRRRDELKTVLSRFRGITDHMPYLVREEQDMHAAAGMFAASLEASDWHTTWSLPHFRWVAFEPSLWLRVSQHAGDSQFGRTEGIAMPLMPNHHVVAQPDAVIYDSEKDGLWLFDLKTTSHSPIQRLDSASVEFQTLHYLNVAQALLDENVLQPVYSLPRSCKLLGMVHLAVLKPNIKFGMNDRPYTEELHTLKSGPRKGETEMRRTYTGEPSLALYEKRCLDHMLGRTDEETRKEREVDPPVNLSIVNWASVRADPWRMQRYGYTLAQIRRYATCPPAPGLFPSTNDVVTGQPDTWREFRLRSPMHWPEVVARNGLMIERRDPYPMPEGRGGVFTETLPWT